MEGYKKCPYCGEEIPENAAKCMYCTAWLIPNQTVGNEGKPSPQQLGYQGPAPTAYAYVNTPQPQSPQANPQPANRKNGMGTAGLVLSILGLVLCWVPIASVLLWFLGLLFSFIGVFKRPRGKAIAGLVISLLTVVFIICIWMIGTTYLNSDMLEELLYYFE